jgi:DNA-directed RNA polymerase subunit L
MPHPLENLLEIKVQTTKESDPLDVMLKTVEDLVREVGTMEKRFNEAVEAVRRDHDDYHEDAHMMH